LLSLVQQHEAASSVNEDTMSAETMRIMVCDEGLDWRRVSVLSKCRNRPPVRLETRADATYFDGAT
jgi:hypothetical protein